MEDNNDFFLRLLMCLGSEQKSDETEEEYQERIRKYMLEGVKDEDIPKEYKEVINNENNPTTK